MPPIIAGIFSLIKVVPAITAIVTMISEMRRKKIEAKVLHRYQQKKQVKETLYERLRSTNDPEEREQIIRDLQLLDPFIDSV